ncbi:ABC transporter ATP-binding protein [Haloarcula sp. CBA1130]|uniref:ABC transporter ATP-binding protein n=1 Tax=unclassified Haloarcula TaxID=2624677 RepID=UPI001245B6EC|nr:MULTISPECIES: ABC transporter ATP-binding protein [unclassified Haloarcula]KAA9395848.1 ABC transporter ATP-binding protein [Haloarcula sp. CBA1129]KAA9400222.1 ABC transporter ATP-binding protein [Haloarcula sp. CBA1130]
MTAIEIESLRKSYGDVTAIANLSLSIDDGEFFGLLGPNGAGKTTTMEILTGQLSPDSGQATVLGVDPATEPTAVRERAGILPEKESPPSFMTPREYFDFVGAIRDMPDQSVTEQTESWADRLGFTAKLDTLSSDLSRGQQQKVMIAGAFFHEPDVVFIDEPLANLDPIVQERVKRFLRSYQDAGNTIVVTTHDVDVAAELCSRVGIMYEGDLVADVRPAELDADVTLLDVFLDNVDPTVTQGNRPLTHE